MTLLGHKRGQRAHGSIAMAGLVLAVAPAALGDPAPTPKSFVVGDEGVAVLTAPAGSAPAAGRTAPRVTLAVYETRAGQGCREPWARIGADAWVCSARGTLSPSAPPAAPTPPARDATTALPWTYAFATRDGTRAYFTAEAALANSDDPASFERWERNWGFALLETLSDGGERALRARSGHYLRRADVYRASPSGFAGGGFWTLAGAHREVPFGWVALGDTWVYPEPSEEGRGAALRRLSLVHVFETRAVARGRSFARIGPAQWVRADHLRWISPAPPPAEIDLARGERWIDVDAANQTLIAYRGAEPVYATMVSTGVARFATEPGVHRIWGRYLAHTMDNTESAHLPNHFRLGDVPYVQFFDGDRGLHAVYWHDGFGTPRSHGCVNLSPRDAAFVFDFTAEPLPPGWVSRLIPPGRGTLVRVRGRVRDE